jgi:6-hydroxytryprostatin B O-methyltransferase
MSTLPVITRANRKVASAAFNLGPRIRPKFTACEYSSIKARGSLAAYSTTASKQSSSNTNSPSDGAAQHRTRTPLQQLAARITAHADALAEFCTKGSHTHTLEMSKAHMTGESPRLLPADAPAAVLAEQTGLQDALSEAAILATDAEDFVPGLAVRNNQFGCLRWICHFRIPEALPVTGPALPYATVADKTGVPLHQLQSIARMAMLAGFLSEPEPGHLAHSALSAAMVRQPALMEWARFVTATSAPMVPAMVEATERWGEDRSPNKTAYAAAWQTELALFPHVASDPGLQARYSAYMRVMTQSKGMALRHVLEGWEAGWSALSDRGGVLVDVGGNLGHAGISIAKGFPGIKVVVQDRDEVIDRAREEVAPGLQLEDQDVKLHVAFQGHDFFLPQPERPQGFGAEGKGDVYLLRQILHDWGDEQSVTILRNLSAALELSGPGGRLVIMDTVLPEPGQISRTEEALLRVRDLTMQQAHNAHERSRAEWEGLFRRADPRLKIQRIVQPFKSLMGIIEVALDQEN